MKLLGLEEESKKIVRHREPQLEVMNWMSVSRRGDLFVSPAGDCFGTALHKALLRALAMTRVVRHREPQLEVMSWMSVSRRGDPQLVIKRIVVQL